MRQPLLGRAGSLIVAAAVCGWLASAALGSELVVTNATDLVNGNTSSAEALLTNSGPDGISLREAVTAVNNTTGPHTIAFSPSLAGATIALQGPGLKFTRDNVTLAGLVGGDERPLITLMPSTADTSQPALFVRSSGFTMTGLRITGVHEGGGVFVLAESPGRSQLTDLRFEGNVFDNTGIEIPKGIPLRINTTAATGATISGIRAVRNTFIHFPTDTMLNVFANDSIESSVSDVVVEENVFIDGLFGAEFGAKGVGNRTSRVRVERNSFTRISGAIPVIAQSGSGNVVEDVVISGNVFADSDGYDVAINGGCVNCAVRNVLVSDNEMVSKFSVENVNIRAGDTANGGIVDNVTIDRNRIQSPERPISIIAGLYSGSGNTIRDIMIRNNLLIVDLTLASAATLLSRPLVAYPSDPATIVIVGGTDQATGNQVDGVSIVNNTLVARSGYGVWIEPDNNGAAGNTITGVTILNTIVSASAGDFHGAVTGDQVSYCLLTGSEFGGANHNLTGDPRFVNSGFGDFHLRQDSPAIGKGSVAEAPCLDFDGLARLADGKVDIGAFEFGATFSRRPCPINAITPAPVAPIAGRP